MYLIHQPCAKLEAYKESLNLATMQQKLLLEQIILSDIGDLFNVNK